MILRNIMLNGRLNTRICSVSFHSHEALKQKANVCRYGRPISNGLGVGVLACKRHVGPGDYGNVLNFYCGGQCKDLSSTFVNTHQILHLKGGILLYINYTLVKQTFLKMYLDVFLLNAVINEYLLWFISAPTLQPHTFSINQYDF